MTTIIELHGREILDSRGNPAMEADLVFEGGVLGGRRCRPPRARRPPRSTTRSRPPPKRCWGGTAEVRPATPPAGGGGAARGRPGRRPGGGRGRSPRCKP